MITNQNIYWPLYKNIESEIEKLLYYIHLDDKQLDVYSTKIAELILRACTEIESITKELYYRFNDKSQNDGYLKFDDAIKFLNKTWKIEEKHIIISSYNCYTSIKQITPFKTKEKRSGSSRMTYKWNNAYQNIKHNRHESKEFGNIENLLLAVGALYILNLYFKDQRFYLDDDYNASKFDLTLGSSIFSVTYHQEHSFNAFESYQRKEDFDSYLYVVYPEPHSYNKYKEVLRKVNLIRDELIQDFLNDNATVEMNENDIQKLLKKEFEDGYKAYMKYTHPGVEKHVREYDTALKNLRYSLIINKNDL